MISVTSDDAYFLGVLSSRVHVAWALAAEGTLEDRPRYNSTRCFETFPFPDATPAQRARIRELGERIDRHRKSRQALYPALGLTSVYNVLEKLRTGESLDAKERVVHEQALVGVLLEAHRELDSVVLEAYGWTGLSDDEVLVERLAGLNVQRAAEEHAGRVRWVRPEVQAPGELVQQDTPDIAVVAVQARRILPPFPYSLGEQAQAIRVALREMPGPATTDDVVSVFRGARRDAVEDLLEFLASLGQVRRDLRDGHEVPRFSA